MRNAQRWVSPLLVLVGGGAACGPAPGGGVAGDDEAVVAQASAGYSNPIIALQGRPQGAPAKGPHALEHTEGCPDPTGIKVGNEYYIYCTSYTFQTTRTEAFPVFKSHDLTSNDWHRVGSLFDHIGDPHSGDWPHWINRTKPGTTGYWGPDVHQLPNGKFVATYGVPYKDSMAVGMAWSDKPTGPWTHLDHPLVDESNNGATGKAAQGSTYDPTLFIADQNGAQVPYLYWVVAGQGVFGSQVEAEASGEIKLVGTTRHIHWGGEGPFMVQHGSAFYLFVSTGDLRFHYDTSVWRADAPLGHLIFNARTNGHPFREEGPVVLHKSAHARGQRLSGKAFVATGGCSVIHDAGGKDYIVYHAIVAGPDSCPERDQKGREFAYNPLDGKPIYPDPKTNPYCREQTERQAMVDVLHWHQDPSKGEWPYVDGTLGEEPRASSHQGLVEGNVAEADSAPALTWSSPGGGAFSGLTTGRNADGREMVFALDEGGSLRHAWRLPQGDTWSSWSTVAGCSSGCGLLGNPVVAAGADGRLVVFARGTSVDPAGKNVVSLWYTSQAGPGGAWHDWSSLPFAIASDASMAMNADGRLEVFALGIDGALWHDVQASDGSFGGGQSLGGRLASAPSAAVNGDGRVEVFARGTDDALWHAWQSAPGAWDTSPRWWSLGGGAEGAPAAIEHEDGRLEVFARSKDGSLWHAARDLYDTWWPLDRLGNSVHGDPNLVKYSDGRVEVFVTDQAGALRHTWQTFPYDTWSELSSLGRTSVRAPGLAIDEDGRLETLVVDGKGTVWQGRQQVAGAW